MTRPVLALDPESRARLLKSAQFSSHHNVKTRAGSQAETKKRISPSSLWPRGPGETIGWRGHMMWGGRSTFGCFNIPRIINQGHQMLLCSTLAAPTAHSGLPSSRSQRILWNLSNKQCSHCLIESVYYTPFLLYLMYHGYFSTYWRTAEDFKTKFHSSSFNGHSNPGWISHQVLFNSDCCQFFAGVWLLLANLIWFYIRIKICKTSANELEIFALKSWQVKQTVCEIHV